MARRSLGNALLALMGLALWVLPQLGIAKDMTVRDDLQVIFAQHGVNGTFVVFNPDTARLILVNEIRARQRMVPASTFKIANSLIALETGVVANTEEVIPYGGKPQPIASWEHDMSLRQAIKISNVPVFQTLARRIGVQRYRDWLDLLAYGNRQVGDDVETFWLTEPLEISAIEQVEFLNALAHQELSASTQSQISVRDIMGLQRRGSAVLYGKTGWAGAPSPDIGWFVGWVEAKGLVYPFALNIDMPLATDLPKRKTIALQMLERLDIY